MYNTKQKTSLIEYLKKQNKPHSANNIALNLTQIGRSTIFRLLASLENEGIVQSCIENRTRLYIYKNQKCHEHIHASCSKCGRFIHLDEDTSKQIEEAMEKSGLSIDGDGVIQCICEKCREGIK